MANSNNSKDDLLGIRIEKVIIFTCLLLLL